jgi:hypothetical protein
MAAGCPSIVSTAKAGGQPEASQELAIQHHASGVFSLEIPYPRKGYQYFVAWPISERAQLTEAAHIFFSVASNKNKARQLLAAFSTALTRSSIAERSLGLYIPEDAARTLRKIAQLTESGMEVPSHLSLADSNSLHRHAWWGTVQLAVADDEVNEPIFVRGERAAAFVPIRQFGILDDLSWGLVRVGIRTVDKASDKPLFDVLNRGETLEMFAAGVLMMLQKAVELR